MSGKKDFRVEVRFKPILKVTWFGANLPGGIPFEQRMHIDVLEDLVLEPHYDSGRFVDAYLSNRKTGTLHLVLDQAEYLVVKAALQRARELEVPRTQLVMPGKIVRKPEAPKKKPRKK